MKGWIIGLLILAGCVSLSPVKAASKLAKLTAATPQQSYSVSQDIPVTVSVDTGGTTANEMAIGVDVRMTFTNLKVMSIDAAGGSFPVQFSPPQITSSSLRLAYVRLDDGVAGANLLVAKVIMRPVAVGPASVAITKSTSSVVALDATNMLNAVSGTSLTITDDAASPPVFTPSGGNFTGSMSVTMTTATSGATIHYTTDGTTPTVNSPIYTTPITLTSTTTVNAIAVKSGLAVSPVTTATYTKTATPPVNTPVISPGTSSFTGSLTVTIATTTDGADIYYTLDGTTPSTSSPKYVGPLTLKRGLTLSAFGYSSSAPASAVATATYTRRDEPIGSGQMSREVWTGIAGTDISDLTSHPNFAQPSNVFGTITSSTTPSNFADNYGQRLRGYITVPEDGTYRFWLSSADSSELFVSSDVWEKNKSKVASVIGGVGQNSWDVQPTQQSSPMTLRAGAHYFFEILHKAGTGSDHLSFGITHPDGSFERPLDSKRLSPAMIGDVKLSLKPLTQTVATGEVVRLTLDYSNPSNYAVVSARITVPLPDTLTYRAGSATPPATVNGQLLSWNIGRLDAKASGTITLDVVVQ